MKKKHCRNSSKI